MVPLPNGPTCKPLGGEHPNHITLPSLLCSVQALALSDVTPCGWTLVYLLDSGLSIQMLVSSRNDVLLGYWTTQLNRHIKMVMASQLGHFKEMEITHTHTHTTESTVQSAIWGKGVQNIHRIVQPSSLPNSRTALPPPKKEPPIFGHCSHPTSSPSLRTVPPLCASACPECFLRTERHCEQA